MMFRNKTTVQLVAVACGLALIRAAAAEPGGMVAMPNAPLAPSTHPAAANAALDAQVSTQTGSFDYAHPITVPPAGRGVAPALSLRYSSRAPTYGDIAAGWTIGGIPEIRIDSSAAVGTSQLATSPGGPYVSTLAGGARLVPVSETKLGDVIATFRAQGDDTYARYELVQCCGDQQTWRVRNPDGTVYHFGQASHYSGAKSGWQLTPVSAAPLTQIVDAFGNQTNFYYDAGRIARIEYAVNPGAGYAQPHARVEFDYESPGWCYGRLIGAHSDFRTGRERRSAKGKLAAIRTFAIANGSSTMRRVRELELDYDDAQARCDAAHGPQLALESIRETAYAPNGTATVLPAKTFGYSARSRALTRDLSWSVPASTAGAPEQALIWGRRDSNEYTWPTVHSMLLDIDADGFQDRLYITDDKTRCEMGVDRGTADGFVATGQRVRLPTLPWGWGKNQLTNYYEECSLTAQKVHIEVNSSPSCRVGSSYFAYRFMDVDGDGRVELVASLNYDVHGLNPNNVWELGLPGGTPGVHHTGTAAASCNTPLAPLRSGTGYVWYVYERRDNGTFAPPRILEAPVRLTANTGDTAMGVGRLSFIEPTQGLADFNGDGLLDAYDAERRETGDRADQWRVWLGNGDGFDDPILWKVPLYTKLRILTGNMSNPDTLDRRRVMAEMKALYDVNGDGLPDLIVVDPHYDSQGKLVARAAVHYNLGDGFDDDPGALYHQNIYVLSMALIDYHGNPFTRYIDRGLRWTSMGPVDLDEDGRLDWFWPVGVESTVSTGDGDGNGGGGGSGGGSGGTGTIEMTPIRGLDPSPGGAGTVTTRSINIGGTPIGGGPGTIDDSPPDVDNPPPDDGDYTDPEEGETTVVVGYEPHVAFNVGGALTPPRPIAYDLQEGLKEVVVFEPSTWRVSRRMTDVTGDGMADVVRVRPDGGLDVETDPVASPLRLLTTIENGRGQQVTVTYAPHTDPKVVTQATGLGKSTSQHMWVVSRLMVEDQFAPTATTDYHYMMPVVGPDWLGRNGFRGFETVLTRRPSDGLTVERFDYEVDPTGRPHMNLVYRGFVGDGSDWYKRPYKLETVDTTVWDELPLTGGEATSYQSVLSTRHTCGAITPGLSNGGFPDFGAAADACAATGVVRTAINNWTAYPSNSVRRLYATSTRYELARPADESFITPAKRGETLVTLTNSLVHTAASYRLVTTAARTFDLFAWKEIGKTETIYDSAKRVPIRVRVLRDRVGGTEQWATTRLAYDAAGQLILRQKPVQFAAGSGGEHYTYDPFGVFVATSTNELGHQTLRKHDYGTGALLREVGPNREACSSCEDGVRGEEKRIVIDGLGRSVEEWSSHGDSYTPVRTVRRWFNDTRYETSGNSTLMREEKLISFATPGSTRSYHYMDGAGRVFKIENVDFESSPDPNQLFEYDAAGRLVKIEVLDPRAETTARVAYRRTYDGLDRLTSERLPGGSGFDLTYNGLETRRKDYVPTPASDEPLGERIERRSVFDHLVEVRERGASGWATTSYERDGAGRIERIVHADGREISMTYDLAGNRTEIEVGTGRWSYRYDDNGNMVTKTTPYGSSASPLDYTSSYVHDDLDRVIQELPARRDLSSSELAQFGIGLETYVYDEGTRAIGRLTRVELPWGTVASEYDTAGNRVRERRSFDLSTALGVPLADTHEVAFEYTPARQVERSRLPLADGAPLDLRYEYNRLGLPARVFWRYGAAESLLSEVQYRGVNAKRWTNLGTQTHLLELDAVGRVRGETVGVDGVEALAELVDLYGAGDVRSVTSDYAGMATRAIDYTYDPQHQLRSATGSAGFSATYLLSSAGQFETVSVTGSGPGLRARNVEYLYEDPRHPEAVTSLASTDAGPSIEYDYDDAGNVIRRADGPTSQWRFRYDGRDQQRIVIGPGGGKELYYYAGKGDRMLSVQLDSKNRLQGATMWFGTLEVQYAPTGGPSSASANVLLASRRVARIGGDGQVELTYHNRLGNLLAVYSQAGDRLAAYIYGPYGEIIDQQGDTSDRRRFNGKVADKRSQLSYYGHRYYDPVSLQWTSADPLLRVAPEIGLSEPRRLNLYGFSLANPQRYLDPDGLDSGDCAAGDDDCVKEEPKKKEQKKESRTSRLLNNVRSGISTFALPALKNAADRQRDAHNLMTATSHSGLLDPLQKSLGRLLGQGTLGRGLLLTAQKGLSFVGIGLSSHSLYEAVRDGDGWGIAVSGTDTAMGVAALLGSTTVAPLYAAGRGGYELGLTVFGGEDGAAADGFSNVLLDVFGPCCRGGTFEPPFRPTGMSPHSGRSTPGGPQP